MKNKIHWIGFIALIIILSISFLFFFRNRSGNEEKLTKAPDRQLLENCTLEIVEGSLTSSGCRVIIKDDTSSKGLWFDTYDYFVIDVYQEGIWKTLPRIQGFNEQNEGDGRESANISPSYLEVIQQVIGVEASTQEYVEMNVNWEKKYGKLEKGSYRLVKWRSDGYSKKYFYAPFVIE